MLGFDCIQVSHICQGYASDKTQPVALHFVGKLHNAAHLPNESQSWNAAIFKRMTRTFCLTILKQPSITVHLAGTPSASTIRETLLLPARISHN